MALVKVSDTKWVDIHSVRDLWLHQVPHPTLPENQWAVSAEFHDGASTRLVAGTLEECKAAAGRIAQSSWHRPMTAKASVPGSSTRVIDPITGRDLGSAD